MKFDKFISEMALSSIKKMGRFDTKRGKFGWDEASRKIISSPNFVERFTKKWENSDYDFNVYLVSHPKLRRYMEEGRIQGDELTQFLSILNIDPEEYEKESENKINIFFHNNIGDSKVPFTPWIMAHRASHVIVYPFRARSGSEYTMRWFGDTIKHAVQNIYGFRMLKTPMDFPNSREEKIYKGFFEQVGTFRSARTNNIVRLWEFFFELGAQYLLNKNKIVFNKNLTSIITGHVWGRPQKTPVDIPPEDVEDIIETLENDANLTYHELFGRAIGSTFVM